MGDGNNNLSQGNEPLQILLTNVKPEDGGDGPRAPEFYKDDFVEPVKQRLGQYLDRTIADAGNVYTPKPGKGFIDEIKPGLGTLAVQAFEANSNSGMFLPEIEVNKTNDPSDPNTVTRTVLHREINLSGDNASLPQKVHRVLEENNRFSVNNPYVVKTEEDSGTKDFIPQQEFGKHTPQKWPIPDGQSNIPVTIKDLKNLGSQILLEASGEAISSRNSSKIGLTPEALAMVTVVPGSARIGTRVARSRFSAGNIMSDINPTFRKPKITDLEDDGPEAMSYGSPYNPLVPFDGLNVTSSRVAASLLTITVSTMITALSAILKNSAAVNIDVLATDDPNQKGRFMGSYSGTARYGLGASGTRFSTMSTTHFLMMYESKFDYTESVQQGLEIFFDLPSGIGTGISANSLANSENPGFYNVLLRSLVRDTSDLFVGSLGLTNNGTSFGGSQSVLSDDPVVGIANNVEKLIQNIRKSRLLRFMDILAKIGDITLQARENNPNYDLSGEVYTDDFIVDINSDPSYELKHQSNINQGALAKRIRLSGDATKPRALSMASNTITSMYMMSNDYVQANFDLLGNTDITNGLVGSGKYFKIAKESNRLSSQDVEDLEEVLDSYYVPFYFHDLRTNEIIAFHAFLDNVSDGFTADYNSSEGQGRIGKVHTYKNTNRSISLSFRAVSTSPADFDEMWLKINKLVMLCYPQYTSGRQVTNLENGYKFTQPFSQIIGASPMIRMRVGDLIKTNFSEIDLARLFGAGTSNFVINEEIQARDVAREQKIQEEIRTKTKEQTKGIFFPDDIVILRSAYTAPIPVPVPEGNGITAPSNSARNITLSLRVSAPEAPGRGRRRPRGQRRGAQNSTAAIPQGTKLKIIRRITPNGYDYVVRLLTAVTEFRTSDDLTLSLEPGSIGSSVELDMESVIARIRSNSNDQTNPNGEITTSNVQNVQDFFSPQGDGGNPITQAFQSTKGQGLPGFIKSIKFDFAEATWDTDRNNARAPQMLKIDIDFEPINDISPGLTSDGFMIGAPYNVGNIMKLLKQKRNNSSTT